MPDHGEPVDREALLEGLRHVGLNGYESSVYLGLVMDQDAKVAEISKRTGVPQPKVYQALDSLVEKGFCALGSDSVNRYRPVAPQVAIEAFVQRLKSQEKSAVSLAGDLEELLQRGKGQELWAPPVEMVKGMRQIKRMLVERIGSAREEILCFCKGPQVAAMEIAVALKEAADRGVSLKLLSDETYYSTEFGHEEQVAIYRSMAGEKRELDNVPTKGVLVDRQIALMSISRPVSLNTVEDFMILVLRHEGLVEHVLNSFQHGWQHSKPLRFDTSA